MLGLGRRSAEARVYQFATYRVLRGLLLHRPVVARVRSMLRGGAMECPVP